jgi:hypothetical protein
MKKIYPILFIVLFAKTSWSQITITTADMPVNGDTLRYSFTTSVTGVDFSSTGASSTWDYTSLIAAGQKVDTYKTALQVNPLYSLISLTAYGYKVADSFPGLGAFLPVTIKGIYTFYNKKNSPSRFIAEGFAATISGIPTPATYQDEDEVYFFPLDYGNTNDSSSFRLSFNLATLGSMVQKGYRKTTVDGWGTIVTPFFSQPLNCIRVRSEIHEVDTIATTVPIAFKIGLPRNTVEYKWLANGEHYPVLWITTTVTGGNETVTSVRYRDYYRPGLLHVSNNLKQSSLKAYPNPSIDGLVTITIPAEWKEYTIEVYDMQSRRVLNTNNTPTLHMQELAKGNYLGVVNHDGSKDIIILTR